MRITGWGHSGGRRGIMLAVASCGAFAAAAGPAQAAITISGPTPVNEGTASAVLRYVVSKPYVALGPAATVRFRTTDGTATPGADYIADPGHTVNLPNTLLTGSSVDVDIPVTNDTLYEGTTNETVVATIDQATGDTIAGGAANATGEIVDNDPKPSVSIAAGANPEGTGSAGAVGLPVTLSAVSGIAVSVPYTITAGSATAPDDIDTTAGTLNIPAGQPGGTISVATVGDSLDEPDETFTVTLGTPPSTQALLGTPSATGTVTNDDTPAASIGGISANEGTGATPTNFVFTVSLSNASTRELSVRATTADVQAKAPADYTAVDQVLTFAAGETSKTVTVPVVADAVDEPNEAFTVALGEPSGLTLAGSGTALGAIIDDDLSTGGGTGTGTGTGTSPGTVTPITTPGGGTGTGTAGSSDRTPPLVTLAALRVKRPNSLTVRVTCPFTETRCTGTVTVFSLVVKKSKVKALRREIRVATGTYVLTGGASTTVTMKLSTKARNALKAAKKIKARAFGVTRDAAGNVGTGTLTATLRR